MTIALAKDVEEFLQEQVRAGVAGDPSELENDVLRCVRDQQRRQFEITPQFEAWLLESADQPATPLTKADFDGIRQRTRKRNPLPVCSSKAARPGSELQPSDYMTFSWTPSWGGLRFSRVFRELGAQHAARNMQLGASRALG